MIVAWSGGKDSALALFEVLASREREVVALLTTVNREYDRVSMHGVRRELIRRQSESVGLTLEEVFLSREADIEEYRSAMREALTRQYDNGVRAVVFGDVFLEDVREYRLENLSEVGMEGIFPVWGEDTGELAQRFIDLGFKAIVTCVDTELLDGRFTGRQFDREYLDDLPRDVDPCGENGEFHSFVWDGPVFNRNVSYTRGEVVLREGRFNYCDLLPSCPASSGVEKMAD